MTGSEAQGDIAGVSPQWHTFYQEAMWPTAFAATAPHEAVVEFARAIAEAEAYNEPLVPPVPVGLGREIVEYAMRHADHNADPDGPALRPPQEARPLAVRAIIFLFTGKEVVDG